MTTFRHARFLLALAVAVTATPVAAQLPAAVNGQELPSLAPMLESVTPAVVNIATKSRVRIRENPLLQDPFFRRFFDLPEQYRQQRPAQSLGSGVVVDAKRGYVLTNNHVIDKADEITVTLQNGRELTAELVGADPETDIAVLKVKPDGVKLTALPLGDSNALRVGDFVVAVGNPFGLGQTVTSGIVSALGRTGLGIEGYEDFIQTDASINPGNSGGALVNLRGELVGINTAILAPSGGNIGIGFAIPSNMAQAVMQQLIEHGEVRRGMLGVVVQDLTPALADALGTDARAGAVVTEVVADSPAAKAGLQVGDVVVAVDGQQVTSSGDLRNRIGLMAIGQQPKLTVRRDGRNVTITPTIAAASQQELDGAKLDPRLEGAVFETASGRPQEGTIVVSAVAANSPAYRAGLRPGDRITSINRQQVENLQQFGQAVQQAGDTILLGINRRGTPLLVAIQ